ncbi:hypothetical protein AA313_de0210296 [Arthrobotrys entomopaga]|nr:hypothetical protein AA313_de0210296 [Arthrobotrys entomopaga]
MTVSSNSLSHVEKIRALANSILEYADKLEQEDPFEIASSQPGKQISTACSELASLVATPRNWVIRVACAYSGCVALSLVLEMGLQKLISNTQATTSLDELAKATKASPQIIKTALVECIRSHIFEEPTPEQYRHNDNSRMLLNENYASWVHFRVDEGFRSGAYLAQSMAANKMQIAEEPSKRAFGMAFNTNQSFYEYYNLEDPVRGARFDKNMAGSSNNGTYGLPVEMVYSFENIGKKATIVDVGGGQGQNCIKLAKMFPEMKFILEDRYSQADTKILPYLPADIRDRIKWQVHDFTKPQPVKGADLYLISQVLMDHQRGACHEILKHVVEAMTPNHSILLISDYMSPGSEGTISPMINALNIHIISILGRAFWTRKEWEDLFAAVSPSLKLQRLEFSEGRAVFELIKVN